MNLRFGLLWSFRNPAFNRVPWQDLYRTHLDLIADSEALGYDHAWLTEHHFVDDGYSPSLLPIAGAVAARTTRIRIGTFLILMPLHNPVRIAEDSATIDLISNGRFDLGVRVDDAALIADLLVSRLAKQISAAILVIQPGTPSVK